jgi:nitrogen fixation protein NifZ
MSCRIQVSKPATIGRVVHDERQRRIGRSAGAGGQREFKPGDVVRALTPVMNDGIDPHRDMGEMMVHRGDAGVVRDSWSFLGEIYYRVEFVARAAVVIMHGREIANAALRALN